MINTISNIRCWPTAPGPAPSKGAEGEDAPVASHSDAFVMTSQEGETFGFSAKEAVAAATQLLVGPAPAQTKQAKSVNIKTVQDQLTKGLSDVEVEFLHTDAFGPLNGRLASEAELTAMIESFRDESGIPFGYIKDGCYARAHMMDESFRQHGLNYAKMFVRGDLSAKNDHMSARWWYHVAPLVFMDDGEGNPVPKIIDPGFSSKPMNPEEWVKAMNQGPSIQVDLVDPEQYYPRRHDKPDTFSESLPPAVKRMQSYSKRLHNMRESKGEDLGDFVKPSWDEPGCGGDFVIDGQRKTVFPEGVKSDPTRIYLGTGATANGPLIELDLPQVDAEVSAAWENRPTDFNPYK